YKDIHPSDAKDIFTRLKEMYDKLTYKDPFTGKSVTWNHAPGGWFKVESIDAHRSKVTVFSFVNGVREELVIVEGPKGKAKQDAAQAALEVLEASITSQEGFPPTSMGQ